MVLRYNIRQVSNLHCLDPVKMDSLLCIRGRIVRLSPIIPDRKVAHFSCCICGHDVQVTIDRGRIAEPNVCPQCHCRDSYTLQHNRCVFADKQLVLLQETPDEVQQDRHLHRWLRFVLMILSIPFNLATASRSPESCERNRAE
jgi:DNA replication licensing factor MCM4